MADRAQDTLFDFSDVQGLMATVMLSVAVRAYSDEIHH